MSDRRWFCPCGYNVPDDRFRTAKFERHRESGEHERMVKVNAVRDAMNRIDAIVEAELQEER